MFLIVSFHIIADHQSVRLIPHLRLLILVGLIFKDAPLIVVGELGLQRNAFRFCFKVQTVASVQRLHKGDRETLVDLDSDRKDFEQRLEASVDPLLVFDRSSS